MSLEPTYDRPESALGRGRLVAPPWVIAVSGALAVVVTIGFVALWVRRRLRAARGESSPISSRGSMRPGPPSSRPPAR